MSLLMEGDGSEIGFGAPSNPNHSGILWKQAALYIRGAAVALSLGRSGLKGVSSAKVPGKELIIHQKLTVKGFAVVPRYCLRIIFVSSLKAWIGIYKLIALVPLVDLGWTPKYFVLNIEITWDFGVRSQFSCWFKKDYRQRVCRLGTVIECNCAVWEDHGSLFTITPPLHLSSSWGGMMTPECHQRTLGLPSPSCQSAGMANSHPHGARGLPEHLTAVQL